MQQGNNIYYGNNSITKLSKDGSTLIIGNYTDHDSMGNWYGSIKVFTWNGNDWMQKGNIIYGQTYSSLFGLSLGISENGNSILVYAPYDMNKVRAYQWNNILSTWVQKGNAISLGSAASTGGAVDFSSDGNTFIVGNPYISNGKVGVFSWDGINWMQKGNIFNGIVNEELGRSVNVNSDGSVIVIGSPLNDNNGNNTGEIKIYQWNGTSWIQKGQTFNGTVPTNSYCCLSNFATSIDSVGNTFAYWSVVSDSPQHGVLKIFNWSGSQWNQKGLNIEGGLGDSTKINFINLNEDGNTVAIGFPYDFYFNDGIDFGRVKIYNWNSGLSTNNPEDFKFNFYPNPSNDKIFFIQEVRTICIHDLSGRIIFENEINSSEMDISKLESGIYIVYITVENRSQNFRLIKK